MAKPYFRQVPNFEYVSRNPGDKYISEYIPVKNLFKRGKIREDIFGNLQFFEKYQIIGDERPDNVAFKFYGDSTLDWVVLLSNNILNIQSEWPMTQRTFDKVMLEKYGSYDNLYNGVHHYETTEVKNSLGVTVLQGGLRISPTWKNNGNFVQIINSRIESIYSSDDKFDLSSPPTKTVTVELQNGIIGLEVGSQILIENVTEVEYNGQHIITEIVSSNGTQVYTFKFELTTEPNIAVPILADPRKEEVYYTIPPNAPLEAFGNTFDVSNSYYYEYWDSGFGYSKLVPATSFIKEVTNYQYEFEKEEAKRNIYVLKPIYLNVIFNDLDDIMPYKRGSQQFVTETLKRGDNIRLYE